LKRSRLVPLAAVFSMALVALLSGCAVELAPGYRITKQAEQIRFVESPQPQLQIRSSYTVLNIGTAPLDSIDVGLPNEKAYGRENVRVTLDGQELRLAELPEQFQYSQPDARRISFESPWQQNQSHDLVVEYSFVAPQLSGARISLADDSFHLGAQGWQPVLLKPHHVLSDTPLRPDKSQYTVRIPSDFQILARGKLSGRKQSGSQTEYRFDLRAEDLGVYVVAGRYLESDSGKSPVQFWTEAPLTDDAAHAESEIAAARDILEKDFGPLDKNIRTIHIVQWQGFGENTQDAQSPALVGFPGGALVNPAELARGVNSPEFLDDATEALAQSWFSEQIYPAPNAVIGIGYGLAGYASITIDEQRGGEAIREKRIRRFLARYDEGVQQLAGQQPGGKPLVEQSIIATLPSDPFEQRRISLAKSPLFYAALEDAAGAANVRAGLAHVVKTLRGQQVTFDDIRSAIESVSGKNLAGLFRSWLYNPGIPADFRARYAASTAGNR